MITVTNLILCSLFVLGMKKILSEDGVLGVLTTPNENLISTANFKGRHLTANLLRYISKPLYYCYPCMASFWGVVFFLLKSKGHWASELFLFVVIVCGINLIIGTVLSTIQKDEA